MTIDTSKNTGYIAQSLYPNNEVVITKNTGYIAQSLYPNNAVQVMKETCYAVLKPTVSKAQIIIINM